jgi:hypothetical protein
MKQKGGSSFKAESRRAELVMYFDYPGDASPPG